MIIKVVFAGLILNTLFGCALYSPFDSAIGVDLRRVVVLKDPDGCRYVGTISPNGKKWREGYDDTVLLEVHRLKGVSIKIGGNAIANVKVFDRNSPVGTADSYFCPKEIFEKNKGNPKDQKYIESLITIIE